MSRRLNKREKLGMASLKTIARNQDIKTGRITLCPFCQTPYEDKDFLASHIQRFHAVGLKNIMDLFELKSSEKEPEKWRSERDLIWDTPEQDFKVLSSGEYVYYKFIMKMSDTFYIKAIQSFPRFYERILDIANYFKKEKEARKIETNTHES